MAALAAAAIRRSIECTVSGFTTWVFVSHCVFVHIHLICKAQQWVVALLAVLVTMLVVVLLAWPRLATAWSGSIRLHISRNLHILLFFCMTVWASYLTNTVGPVIAAAVVKGPWSLCIVLKGVSAAIAC